ncbi:MAG: hypothetical protein MUF12_09170 [Sediminibacterium sp.]|nr:hypothetical protein [Sediminibacterium sp.]
MSFSQDQLQITGHSIEVRVYAEDPKNNFLPDIGNLRTYVRPQGPGVRVDDGFEEGMDIPIYYDPMIAKLITTGKTREEAIEKMKRAIDEYEITGIETTLQFCKFVMEHEVFLSGKFDTNFISLYYKPEVLSQESTLAEVEAATALATFLFNRQKPALPTTHETTQGLLRKQSNWKKNRIK